MPTTEPTDIVQTERDTKQNMLEGLKQARGTGPSRGSPVFRPCNAQIAVGYRLLFGYVTSGA
jgi:hypothetical protein